MAARLLPSLVLKVSGLGDCLGGPGRRVCRCAARGWCHPHYIPVSAPTASDAPRFTRTCVQLASVNGHLAPSVRCPPPRSSGSCEEIDAVCDSSQGQVPRRQLKPKMFAKLKQSGRVVDSTQFGPHEAVDNVV